MGTMPDVAGAQQARVDASRAAATDSDITPEPAPDRMIVRAGAPGSAR
jgi:hypothetical protein